MFSSLSESLVPPAEVLSPTNQFRVDDKKISSIDEKIVPKTGASPPKNIINLELDQYQMYQTFNGVQTKIEVGSKVREFFPAEEVKFLKNKDYYSKIEKLGKKKAEIDFSHLPSTNL